MLERFKRSSGGGAAGERRVADPDQAREGEPTRVADRRGGDGGDGGSGRGRAAAAGAGAGAAAASGRDRHLQAKDEFGGFNWGAAFFGWLVAVGLAAILTALLTAAGGAIGLSQASASQAAASAGTISLIGAIVLLVILFLAYYCGGYVAGRMSRFDGARQGFGVWVIGILITIVLAVAGALFGSEYNVLQQLNLPRIPVEEGDLAKGGLIALAAFIIATLLGAILGGKVGERYHRKVDRVAHGA